MASTSVLWRKGALTNEKLGAAIQVVSTNQYCSDLSPFGCLDAWRPLRWTLRPVRGRGEASDGGVSCATFELFLASTRSDSAATGFRVTDSDSSL